MFWNFSSAPALRRRSSVLALSSLDINENGNKLQMKSSRDFNRDYPLNADPLPVSSTSQQFVPTPRSISSLLTTSAVSSNVSSELTAKSAKHFKRTYDGVYRTNEPLPGKPLIEFEDKVWDLEDEFYTANEKINF